MKTKKFKIDRNKDIVIQNIISGNNYYDKKESKKRRRRKQKTNNNLIPNRLGLDVRQASIQYPSWTAPPSFTNTSNLNTEILHQQLKNLQNNNEPKLITNDDGTRKLIQDELNNLTDAGKKIYNMFNNRLNRLENSELYNDDAGNSSNNYGSDSFIQMGNYRTRFDNDNDEKINDFSTPNNFNDDSNNYIIPYDRYYYNPDNENFTIENPLFKPDPPTTTPPPPSTPPKPAEDIPDEELFNEDEELFNDEDDEEDTKPIGKSIPNALYNIAELVREKKFKNKKKVDIADFQLLYKYLFNTTNIPTIDRKLIKEVRKELENYTF
jgi:hypothetical protein